MKRFFKIFISLAVIGSLIYIYRNPLQTLFIRFAGVSRHCEKPIAYKIASFDTRFGITEDYFLSALRDAENIWEKPLNLQLFNYGLTGDLKINLIYDYRQEATVKLQKLGLTVSNDQTSYNNLKMKYNSLKASYTKDAATFKTKVANYETQQKAYEKEVAYWNARHGAPPDVYNKLNADRAALAAELATINQLQTKLNEEVDNMNAMVVVLNRMANSLNLGVAKYNTVGQTIFGEFEEANYQNGPNGPQIDIYEYDNRTKLVRVLTHELGHALGLGHVDDPDAIMYRLNAGLNGQLTVADLTALKTYCNIK